MLKCTCKTKQNNYENMIKYFKNLTSKKSSDSGHNPENIPECLEQRRKKEQSSLFFLFSVFA